MAWRAVTRFSPTTYGHELYIMNEHHDGGRDFVSHIELTRIQPGGLAPESSIPPEDVEQFLQAMLNAAWKIGLTPTGFEDHKSELTAVRYHLEDMRKLAKVT